MIKMTCAYHAAITETKVKKRHVIDPCIGKCASFYTLIYEFGCFKHAACPLLILERR